MFPHKHHFIRHAHRNAFESNDWGHNVPIIPFGEKKSEQLGKTLAKSRINAIWTSPIKRCIQTAEKIKIGIGIDIPIHYSSLLGDPGFMISNPQLAESAFHKYKLVELIDLLLREESVPGFYSINTGCVRILKKLLVNAQSEQVWISHDMNICMLACWIFRSNQPENMMPEFLEGIEFSFDETGIFAYFKGLSTKIDETVLRETVFSTENPAFLNK